MTFEANGIQQGYEQAGTGQDVVLVPGLGAAAWIWKAQLDGLSQHARVTAVDPRGHGQSAKPAGPYTPRLFADDLAALIRGLDLYKPVVVGSSMSAMTVIELAAGYPHVVSGAVLVGGFAKVSPTVRERMEARADRVETEGMAPVVDLVATTALGATTHAEQPEVVQLFKRHLATNNPVAYATACRAIVEGDVTPRLGEIRCPTLIVMGAEEQVASIAGARAMKTAIRNCDVRAIARAGHLPFLEQPAAFNAVLVEFLCTLPLSQERL